MTKHNNHLLDVSFSRPQTAASSLSLSQTKSHVRTARSLSFQPKSPQHRSSIETDHERRYHPPIAEVLYPDIILVRVYSSYTTRLEYRSSLFPIIVPCYPLLLLLYYLVGISDGYVYEGYVYYSKMHNRSERARRVCVKNMHDVIS